MNLCLVFSFYRKIVEREDELFIVGNILKSLEVSEEKANQRVEDFKVQLKGLKAKLKEAEKRAITAEKTVRAFLVEMDVREGQFDGLSKFLSGKNQSDRQKNHF